LIRFILTHIWNLFICSDLAIQKGRLGTLSTQDLRQISSKYKHIIGIKGENVLNFTFSINECKDIKNVKDEYKLGFFLFLFLSFFCLSFNENFRCIDTGLFVL
jgi:hypothetical protein